MGNFAVYIDETRCDDMLNKSHKGTALMQYLIINEEQPVPNQRLLATLWSDDKTGNPENALKTLVSRTRAMLNQISPGFGNCIVADRGAYRWENGPGMSIDLYEINRILADLPKCKEDDETSREMYRRLMALYPGDLLQNSDPKEWTLTLGTALHNKYLSSVYAYVELLKRCEDHKEIVNVCRQALDVDNFDDHLHMELMSALIKINRTSEALVQYKHVMHLNYRYLGVQPSDDMREFYKQIVHAGKTLEFNLESIREQLRESEDRRGAFVCEYAVFKEIFNLQMRNLERLGSTMFLAVVMVSDINGLPMESIKQDNIMNGLLEIMKSNLRKGDTITQVTPTIFALLLPTVNYSTGNMVMDRVKRLFYQKYPNSNVAFNYRVGPLSSSMEASATQRKQTEV